MEHIQPYVVDMLEIVSAHSPKESAVLVRVSQEEKKLMKLAAEAEDRNVSDWVRITIKNRLRELGIVPEKKPLKKKIASKE